MSNTHNEPLSKLLEYARKIEETQYDIETRNGERRYEMRLNRALQQLREQVKQHQDALERPQVNPMSSSLEKPSQDTASRVRQLQVITAAYKSLTVAQPLLPSADSPLPALLALRSTHNLILQTQTLILATNKRTAEARTQLHQEKGDLHDAQLIFNALTQRAERLRSEYASRSQVSSKEMVEAMILDQQIRKRQYMKDLRSLVKAFNRFVEGHLAGMLAAEELNGPVVGDMMEVDGEASTAGFNQQAKPKKLRKDKTGNDFERKRQIDGIWGPSDRGDSTEARQRSETEAAGAAFRALTEDLLNAAADEEGLDPYVDIPQETAPVRFLVRAKVAQFHPHNARRLRLVDFTRDFEL
ncbi:hypothetical protein MMC07_002424 [Pseudocyphellaria aurata]|nr:hypothetical protein [Pseudocyphellaria aurata]